MLKLSRHNTKYPWLIQNINTVHSPYLNLKYPSFGLQILFIYLNNGQCNDAGGFGSAVIFVDITPGKLSNEITDSTIYFWQWDVLMHEIVDLSNEPFFTPLILLFDVLGIS